MKSEDLPKAIVDLCWAKIKALGVELSRPASGRALAEALREAFVDVAIAAYQAGAADSGKAQADLATLRRAFAVMRGEA